MNHVLKQALQLFYLFEEIGLLSRKPCPFDRAVHTIYILAGRYLHLHHLQFVSQPSTPQRPSRLELWLFARPREVKRLVNGRCHLLIPRLLLVVQLPMLALSASSRPNTDDPPFRRKRRRVLYIFIHLNPLSVWHRVFASNNCTLRLFKLKQERTGVEE
jgi:hypothetical protein